MQCLESPRLLPGWLNNGTQNASFALHLPLALSPFIKIEYILYKSFRRCTKFAAQARVQEVRKYRAVVQASVHAGAPRNLPLYKMSLPDYFSYIPVECTESESKYFGQCYMEKISSVHVLNDEVITKERQLQKSDFKTGGVVIIRYQSKDFHGVVDLSRDKEILTERESQCGAEKYEFGVDRNVTSSSRSPRLKRRRSTCRCCTNLDYNSGASTKSVCRSRSVKKPHAPGKYFIINALYIIAITLFQYMHVNALLFAKNALVSFVYIVWPQYNYTYQCQPAVFFARTEKSVELKRKIP